MDLHLQDKVYIVSGGSKGIGEGISRALAEEGAIPVIATRSRGVSEKLVGEIESEGGKALFIPVELGTPESAAGVIQDTLAKLGRIDGIVNNAGRNDGIGLEKGKPQAFRQSVGQNLFHYYDLVHYALPQLIEHKGVIVNVSSKVALTGQGGTSGYAASKGAQLALTREWAAELLPHGIRVNAILPAEVMTPLYRNWLDNSFDDPGAKEREILTKIPLGHRMTTVREIADMTLFLLSDRSAHTTGQFIIVDGGYVHLDRSLT